MGLSLKNKTSLGKACNEIGQYSWRVAKMKLVLFCWGWGFLDAASVLELKIAVPSYGAGVHHK